MRDTCIPTPARTKQLSACRTARDITRAGDQLAAANWCVARTTLRSAVNNKFKYKVQKDNNNK